MAALPDRAGRTSSGMTSPEQKKANRRMGIVLASIALVFFVGFVAKMVFLAR